ncbi:MAG: GtrA family protein [Prevotellaceae bacterium]|jgi:putative flippase GtrA|nr:GtrA family protein [Prevotellaceae bacterium]
MLNRNLSFLSRLTTFFKAQSSACAGGILDYLTMILLTRFCGLDYIISTTIGCVLGAVINFSLNKTWAFRSKTQPYRHSPAKQFWRFGFVVVSSILLKISGTYFITEFVFGNDKYYWLSRLIADGIVSICYTYSMQHFWVFCKEKKMVQDN